MEMEKKNVIVFFVIVGLISFVLVAGKTTHWFKDFHGELGVLGSISPFQNQQPRVVYMPNPQPSASVQQANQSSSVANSSGGGLREETEKITLGYDGQADKYQDTRNLEFIVPPLPVTPKTPEAYQGGDEKKEVKDDEPKVDTSKTWTQWVIAPTGPYTRYTLYQPELVEGEVMYYQFWYENDPRPLPGDSFLEHRTNVPDADVKKPVFAYRFRNPNNKPVIVVSQIRNR